MSINTQIILHIPLYVTEVQPYKQQVQQLSVSVLVISFSGTRQIKALILIVMKLSSSLEDIGGHDEASW